MEENDDIPAGILVQAATQTSDKIIHYPQQDEVRELNRT